MRVRLALAALILSVLPAHAFDEQSAPGFDFYVLSLSWSPSYCEAAGDSANRQQCASGRPYAFVVHGLWPQYERGFPKNCRTAERVPQSLLVSLLDIMPAPGLIIHEWRTHGACTGLNSETYFDTLRKARETVTIPPEYRRLTEYQSVEPDAVEQAFLGANPGLRRNGTSVSCDKRYLTEVRICMTKDLTFRACPELERRTCRAAKVVMPPVRGGG